MKKAHFLLHVIWFVLKASELRQLRSYSTMLENIEESERYGSEEKLLDSDTTSADVVYDDK